MFKGRDCSKQPRRGQPGRGGGAAIVHPPDVICHSPAVLGARGRVRSEATGKPGRTVAWTPGSRIITNIPKTKTRIPMKTLYLKDRSEWRAWLRKNSRSSDEIWLSFYKKKSGKPCFAYDHAVEEALCFAWIDSKVKNIDEARYAHRFTPRKPQSRWSALNIKRAEKLIAEGKMTPAGLRAFNPQVRRETPSMPERLPKDLEKQFQMKSDAWEHFKRFPPSYRRITIGWVASAKKEETRLKRLNQLIEFSARNKRIKFM